MKKALTLLLIPIVIAAGLFVFFTFLTPVESEPAPLQNQNSQNSSKGADLFLDDFTKIKEKFISEKTSFVEANLSEMKVRVWIGGMMAKEMDILAKGDPQEWGGSAAGLYKILYGNELSFSVIAEVYMPFALKYYGKYYFHGEPFFMDGEKRFTDATGGCIQLSDQDAKDLYALTSLDMPVLVIDKENDDYKYAAPHNKFPEISAKSYLVADLESGFIFKQKNYEEQMQIASLTKLMTAIAVSENIDLRKRIIASPDALESGYGGTQGLNAGKEFGVVELFYPLLIESSNDAAEVLSHFMGRERTIARMNEKAKMILMENTNFADPSGYDPKNVSTAKDLFYLARYIINDRPPIFKITKNETVNSYGLVRFRDLASKNFFLDNEEFVGGKTGYIKTSAHTGLFVFKLARPDGTKRDVVIILLGSTGEIENSPSNLERDARDVLSWLKENFFNSVQ